MTEENQQLPTETTKPQITQDLGRFGQHEVVQKADTAELQLLKCPTCGHPHFRHAGYVIPLLPFEEKQEAKVSAAHVPVYICVKDKTSFFHYDGKIQLCNDFVDLNAWEQTEKEAHKATGPGGQC